MPEYSSKFSKKTFTQDQHIAIGCIRVKRGKTKGNRRDAAEHADRMRSHRASQRPDFSTMCKAMQRLIAKVFMVMLYLTACLVHCSGKTSIDSTSLDKRYSSKYRAVPECLCAHLSEDANKAEFPDFYTEIYTG